jgi:DNA-binding MarR family transcriptional regulator
MAPTPEECAHELIDVIPDVIQVIRAEVRRQRGRDLSILQLRALIYLARNPGATLSAVADHVGLTLSSMSTQVSKLVQRKLVERNESPHDRRFITLVLTPTGEAHLQEARRGAEMSLAVRCQQWSPSERATVVQAMAILRDHFSTPLTEPEQ